MTYPALELLLQGYFHQDWMLDYATPWAAIDDFSDDDPTLGAQLAAEIASILAADPTTVELRQLIIDRLGSSFSPEHHGYTTGEWLQAVARRSARPRLIELVTRLQAGDYASEADADHDAEAFQAAVLHPAALGLVFWPDREFDHEPTPDEVVDRALAYRPIAL